mgnify:CR=1 FL=1
MCSSDLLLVIDVLYVLWQASQKGETISFNQLCKRFYFVPDDELNRQLEWLKRQNYIAINQGGEYLLCHDLSCLSFKSLYKNGSFKIPVQATKYFVQYQPLLDDYWQPVDAMLNQPIEFIFNKKQSEKQHETT